MRPICISLLILVLLSAGCRNNQTHQAEEESGHAHGEGSVPYTAWSDSCEYFAEISPMIRGQEAEASVHITRLGDYKPFGAGKMILRVIRNGSQVGSGDTDKPRVPGIFPVKFTPAQAGTVSLEFIFISGAFRDSVLVPVATVYENPEAAEKMPPAEKPAGVTGFTKEMAWKTNFAVYKVVPREYRNTIKVSGELMISPSELNVLGAKSDGILVYRHPGLVPGLRVAQGTLLFTLTGQGLTTRNMNVNMSALKNRFEASREACERERPLVKDLIVSQKQFNETMARYRNDSLQYFSYLNSLSGNSMNIVATSAGYIQQLYQPNGAFVTEGTPLAAIGSTNRIMLRADLPQRHWAALSQVSGACFRPSGSDRLYDLDEMDGRLVAKSPAVSTENPFIQVTFEFANNGSFVAGSFAEVYLHTAPVQNQVVLPVSALLEEQGNYYVYVQVAGESFLKRAVKPGNIDGEEVNIASGLAPGDRVVIRGGIFIKAASLMTGAPSHGHAH